MATPTLDTSKLLHLFDKHFARKSRRVRKKFLENITFVLKNYKPAYLIDCMSVSEEEVSRFLSDVREEYSCPTLSLFNVASELFIVDLRSLNDLLLHKSTEKLSVVDVSECLSEPTLLCSTKSKDIICGIVELLKSKVNDSTAPIVEFFDADLHGVNRTTLYGFLLGYPVLYWYISDSESGGNCLSMQDLVLNTVKSRDPNVIELIYSFSYPLNLSSSLEHHVKSWFENLAMRCGDSVEFSMSVCDGMPTVAL